MAARQAKVAPAALAPADTRRGKIALVHIASKDLAMTEETYRAVLQRVTGHDSSAKCTDRQLMLVLDEMKRLGWKNAGGKLITGKPHVRKVWAMWASMSQLVEDPSRQALQMFVLRQTGLISADWLDGKQANKVIEGLKAWKKRLLAAAKTAKGDEHAV